MNFTKLTYEQFCEKYLSINDDAIIAELQRHHGVDGKKEIDSIKRAEYQDYLDGISV